MSQAHRCGSSKRVSNRSSPANGTYPADGAHPAERLGLGVELADAVAAVEPRSLLRVEPRGWDEPR
jgi:hypothetical protein